MPGGDRTGPMGLGAMSGRRAGFCAGSGVPGYANPLPGRGMGMAYGREDGFGGRGRGWRHRRFAPGSPALPQAGPFPGTAGVPGPETEPQILQRQLALLQAQLEQIQQRLGELDRQTDNT